jgi:hypothetical protein
VTACRDAFAARAEGIAGLVSAGLGTPARRRSGSASAPRSRKIAALNLVARRS